MNFLREGRTTDWWKEVTDEIGQTKRSSFLLLTKSVNESYSRSERLDNRSDNGISIVTKILIGYLKSWRVQETIVHISTWGDLLSHKWSRCSFASQTISSVRCCWKRFHEILPCWTRESLEGFLNERWQEVSVITVIKGVQKCLLRTIFNLPKRPSSSSDFLRI